MKKDDVINPELLEYLVCPICRAELELEGQKLICINDDCRQEYSIKDGIPDVLPPEKG